MDRSADSVRSDAPPAANCEGRESARAPAATDRSVVLIGCPDRLVDAELEDVPLRIVLPHARGRDEGQVVYPPASSGAERSKSSQFTAGEHSLDSQGDAPAESLCLFEDSPRQRSRPLTSKGSTFAPPGTGAVSTWRSGVEEGAAGEVSERRVLQDWPDETEAPIE